MRHNHHSPRSSRPLHPLGIDERDITPEYQVVSIVDERLALCLYDMRSTKAAIKGFWRFAFKLYGVGLSVSRSDEGGLDTEQSVDWDS